MTKSELLATLKNFAGCTFLALEAATVPKMLKRGNPLIGKEVVKHTRVTGRIGSSYKNEVNNERFDAYGDDIAIWNPAELPWGEWVEGCSLIELNGKYYLRVIVDHLKWRYFTVDGEPVADEVVTCWLPKKKNEGDRQGLPAEKVVIVRNYKLESIRAIQWFKRLDEITD